MKLMSSCAIVVTFSGTAALGSSLNISIKSGGSNVVTARPDETINFVVEGVLTDVANEGLALVGFDLQFTGGPLRADTIVTPSGPITCANPMPAFVKPDGITNPAGFGGSLVGGNLIQVGGAQNTIKNSVDNPACAPDCAPFPIGAVLTGVAQPFGCGPAILAIGSLTFPIAPGPHELRVSNLFANVIKDGETGEVFWATEKAGAGTITNLRIGACAAVTPIDVAGFAECLSGPGGELRAGCDPFDYDQDDDIDLRDIGSLQREFTSDPCLTGL